jgi:hypothetical protein
MEPYKTATDNASLMDENQRLKEEIAQLKNPPKPKHWLRFWHLMVLSGLGALLSGEGGGLSVYYLPTPWAGVVAAPLFIFALICAVLCFASFIRFYRNDARLNSFVCE